MGRGDQRSKKGKIAVGSYGRLRPRKKSGKPAKPKK
jgi:ribosomal small subunit protein bTHX